MITITEKKFNLNGNTYSMAAVLIDGSPFVQVTQLYGAGRHVRAVSVPFPVRKPEKAVSFVNEATEEDLSRALVKMKQVLDGAERIQQLLTQFNKPPAPKFDYEAYRKGKRFK